MRAALTRIAFPTLRLLDAEHAHMAALLALRSGLVSAGWPLIEPRLRLTWLGMKLDSPVGLAAGFDKDATCLPALERLGLGTVELGTVTPLPQAGNPRPRLFRLAEEGAIINRMGFNSGGMARFVTGLGRRRRRMPVGVNVGPNRGSADPIAEFAGMVAALRDLADWVTINVSSPNTPGLRALQTPERLADLLQAIAEQVPDHPPLLIKLAPDLDPGLLPEIVETCVEAHAAGLVISNTMLARPVGLKGRHAREAGGLSGKPLMAASTAMLARAARAAKGRLALVGVGGIASGADVITKLRAGAGMVQLYSALALQGPALLDRLRREMLAELDRQGFDDISCAVGAGL